MDLIKTQNSRRIFACGCFRHTVYSISSATSGAGASTSAIPGCEQENRRNPLEIQGLRRFVMFWNVVCDGSKAAECFRVPAENDAIWKQAGPSPVRTYHWTSCQAKGGERGRIIRRPDHPFLSSLRSRHSRRRTLPGRNSCGRLFWKVRLCCQTSQIVKGWPPLMV